MKRFICATIALIGLPAMLEGAHAEDAKPTMPPLKMQPNAEMVAFEHIDALNKCDWNRLMAQYPEETLFILPNGNWVEGRSHIGDLFSGFCKDRANGGFKGATFIAEKVKTVGDTVNVSWRVEAPWLAQPYKGGDAYETKDGLMYTQVTTFDPADMKFKK
jgi:ketosteroid isomerase-like protein